MCFDVLLAGLEVMKCAMNSVITDGIYRLKNDRKSAKSFSFLFSDFFYRFRFHFSGNRFRFRLGIKIDKISKTIPVIRNYHFHPYLHVIIFLELKYGQHGTSIINLAWHVGRKNQAYAHSKT